MQMEEKAVRATCSNDQAAEAIWTTWADIITNLIGFAVYLSLLSFLNPILAAVVVVTTIVGYVINNRINEWGYRHREEEAAYTKDLDYIINQSANRSFAKDIRIFGLDNWLQDVWNSTMRVYIGRFWQKRESIYLYQYRWIFNFKFAQKRHCLRVFNLDGFGKANFRYRNFYFILIR